MVQINRWNINRNRQLRQEEQPPLHVPRLEKLNHDVLDHLAWQFHCDHYEPSTMSLEVKRNLIRQSIAWHKIKGTPASVENFLGAFGIKAQVEEWYTYDGEPYFFRLKLLILWNWYRLFFRLENMPKFVRAISITWQKLLKSITKI